MLLGLSFKPAGTKGTEELGSASMKSDKVTERQKAGKISMQET